MTTCYRVQFSGSTDIGLDEYAVTLNSPQGLPSLQQMLKRVKHDVGPVESSCLGCGLQLDSASEERV